jgi:hypothetical protein
VIALLAAVLFVAMLILELVLPPLMMLVARRVAAQSAR